MKRFLLLWSIVCMLTVFCGGKKQEPIPQPNKNIRNLKIENQEPQKPRTTKNEPAKDNPVIDFENTVFSVSRIDSIIEGKDSIPKNEALGKMIKVKGKVFDIVSTGHPAGPFFVLSYIPEGSEYEIGAIRCFFLRNFPSVKRGDMVTVRGKLNGREMLYIDMAFCTLRGGPAL